MQTKDSLPILAPNEMARCRETIELADLKKVYDKDRPTMVADKLADPAAKRLRPARCNGRPGTTRLSPWHAQGSPG